MLLNRHISTQDTQESVAKENQEPCGISKITIENLEKNVQALNKEIGNFNDSKFCESNRNIAR